MCPLQTQCVAAAPGTGRTVQLHPQEALLQHARALQQSEAFGEYRQRRVVVEHRLARLVQLGIRQSRYFGRRQDEIPTVSGGHGGQPDPGRHQGRSATDTGDGSSAGSALRAGTTHAAFDFVPARIAQILTLALLASASLPEYIFPYRASRPDF